MCGRTCSLFLSFGCFGLSLGFLSHVEKYEVIRPERLQQRSRRSLKAPQLYPDSVQFLLRFGGGNHTVHLEKNRGLFAAGYTETKYSEHGERVTTRPTDQDQCLYQGVFLDQPDSSVSVSLCSGISGVLRLQQQVFFIQPLEHQDQAHQDQAHQDQAQQDQAQQDQAQQDQAQQDQAHQDQAQQDQAQQDQAQQDQAQQDQAHQDQAHQDQAQQDQAQQDQQAQSAQHAVYRQEDVKDAGRKPTQNQNKYQNQDQDQNKDQDQDRGPQPAALFKSGSWKYKGVFGPQKFVEVFVVVDNTEFRRFGADTRRRVLEALNHVDQLYRPLNLRLLLVGLEIWTRDDLIVVDANADVTLDHFLSWRRSELLPRTPHDNAQLITGRDFGGDTVGLANKFAMCTQNSGGVNQDHHDSLFGLASTIAHELGHNFGLSHDANSCVCGPSYSGGNCVMTEKLRTGSQVFPEFFSGCSVDQLKEFLLRAQPDCLDRPADIRTADASVAAAPRCGNALLDPGEECDCGTPEECNTPCCDASTCRLTAGSRCSEGLCCQDCQLKSSGSVCRPSAGDCDLPEFCSGTAADCPEDVFQFNGKPCYNQAAGFCRDGRCPTQQHHCWRLFGPGASVASQRCFDLNRQGVDGANCGRSRFGFTACSPDNLQCGSIFCDGGGESITGKRAAFSVSGIECRVAVDDDKKRKIDRVPEGAKCGPEKVCVDSRCVDVSVYGRQEDCSRKCSNNGVCNHKQECHCPPGWAPPFCLLPYSEDHEAQSGWVAGVCASLSVFLLLCISVTVFICWKKRNMENYSSKRKSVSGWRGWSLKQSESGDKMRPLVAPPTFLSFTVAPPTSPGRSPRLPPPQPPEKPSAESNKPVAPSKPLPPLRKPQFKGPKPSAPPPPPPPPPSLSPPPPPPPPSLSPPPPPLPPIPPPKPRITTSS